MADHSLRGYLERQTTEVLDTLLAYYLCEENYANYEHVILEILSILNDRSVPEFNSEMTRLAKEMLLRYKPKD